jgi:membrane-associated protease RseP (regulator of RpoE activity)
VTLVWYLLGVLVLATGVAVSIALHEVGHLLPAKRFGVRVTQYMVGFGPTLWSRRRGETEYGVKAIPLGGYIRMIGMFPPKAGDDPATVRVSSTGRFASLVDEARRTSLEEVRPGDERRVFYRLPTWQKLVVMLGGPTMNLLIAVVLLTGLVTLHGTPTEQPGATVAAVSECVVPASEAATTTTCTDQPKTPAYVAGLRPGDRFVSIAGTPVESPDDVGELVRPRVDQPTEIVVDRDGEQVSVTATPIRNTVQVYDDAGKPVVGADGTPQTTEAGFLGVSSAPPTAYQPQPVTEVPGVVADGVWRTAGAIVRIPERMVGVYQAAFGGQERSLDSPVSVVGVGRVAGDVSSGRLDSLVGENAADRFWFLVGLIASLNIMLFVFNLIPLLPLDGGHVAGALWEAVKRRWARWRGRPDPGYVDVAKALPVAYGVSMVLLVMSALLIYADIVNPVRLGG